MYIAAYEQMLVMVIYGNFVKHVLVSKRGDAALCSKMSINSLFMKLRQTHSFTHLSCVARYVGLCIFLEQSLLCL